ncbi:MAG: hypothetical protein DHS20C14_06970 [Phycisphaeraceae bacterium]|nr:MAG: hypothetical protein DHS20C14_06970 [Phycisphaeraceae bacterium]
MRTRTDNLGRAARPAFTLIELLVVILIIALMMGLLLAGVRAILRASQGVADLQAARTMGTAIDQFQQENGFLVPLTVDGNPLSPANPPEMPVLVERGVSDGILAPLDGDYNNLPLVESTYGAKVIPSIAVYSPQADIDFFRGGKYGGVDGDAEDVLEFNFSPGAGSRASDVRYSKFALPIYLSGVLDRAYDGIDGPGLTKPLRDGTFAGVTGEGSREPIDAYIDPTVDFIQIAQAYIDPFEAAEHQGGGTPTGQRQFARPFVDRYGRAFRYYRWEPGRSTVVAEDLGSGDASVGATRNAIDTNIPFVVSDMLAFGQHWSGSGISLPAGITAREQVDTSGGDAELKRARWAIVGAGPDGLFGTEPMTEIDPGGKANSPEDVIRLRANAQNDNVVILGR